MKNTKEKKKIEKNSFSYDEVRDLLGIEKFSEEDLSERVAEVFCEVRSYEMKYNNRTEEEAEKIAVEEESKEYGKRFKEEREAVLKVAKIYFGYHNLDIDVHKRNVDLLVVSPKHTWVDSAKNIIQTINGHGMFFFRDVDAFARSVPCTVRTAVLTHLHWLHWWGEIYGDASPKALYYKELD